MINQLNQFYLSKGEPNRGCLLALRSIILKQDKDITETLKWGMPCFCFRKKIFCYLWVDKKTKEPYLLMAEGKHLHHPQLETGSRSRMKVLRVTPTQNLPLNTIELILNQALDLYKTGVVKIR